MLPSQYLDLSLEEKAFIIACIQIRIKKEKEEARKIKSKKR